MLSAQKRSIKAGRGGGGKAAVKSSSSSSGRSSTTTNYSSFSNSSSSSDNSSDSDNSSYDYSSSYDDDDDTEEEDTSPSYDYGSSYDDDDDEEEEEDTSPSYDYGSSYDDDDEEEESVAPSYNYSNSYDDEDDEEEEASPRSTYPGKSSYLFDDDSEEEEEAAKVTRPRSGKAGIKDNRPASGKDLIKDPKTEAAIYFLDNVLEIGPRPGTRDSSWIHPDLTPRPGGPKGYSSGSYNVVSSGTIQAQLFPELGSCISIPPPPEEYIEYETTTPPATVLNCILDARDRLEQLYNSGQWCEPGFLTCFGMYLSSMQNCVNCLAATSDAGEYQADLIRYQSEYDYYLDACANEDGLLSNKALLERYLRIKYSMIPGLLVKVDPTLPEDRIYLDSAFGLPYGGWNYYQYMLEFNPDGLSDTLSLIAATFPSMAEYVNYQQLEVLPGQFRISNFRGMLLDKIRYDYNRATSALMSDQAKALEQYRNCYYLAAALGAMDPTDIQPWKWQERCIEQLRKYGQLDETDPAND